MAEDSFTALPPDRRTARLTGSPRYFTGTPCPQGHLAPRFTSNWGCSACIREVLDIRREHAGVCSIAGCGRPADSRTWCHTHFERWRKTGDVQADVPVREIVSRPLGGPCAVEGCEKPTKGGGRGWCSKHYARWQRCGDVSDPAPRPSACPVDGCTKPPSDTKGYCRTHHDRLRRHGDPNIVKKKPVPPNSEVTYFTLHGRIRRARGRASERQCICCDHRAAHWAHVHGEDPCNLESYVPLCRSCHAKYDGPNGPRSGRVEQPEEIRKAMASHRDCPLCRYPLNECICDEADEDEAEPDEVA